VQNAGTVVFSLVGQIEAVRQAGYYQEKYTGRSKKPVNADASGGFSFWTYAVGGSLTPPKFSELRNSYLYYCTCSTDNRL
jgi:hypothetical protein